MRASDFQIGDFLWWDGTKFYVTDVGVRVVIAVPSGETPPVGPPYAGTEIVFTEYDLNVVSKTQPEDPLKKEA